MATPCTAAIAHPAVVAVARNRSQQSRRLDIARLTQLHVKLRGRPNVLQGLHFL